MDNVDYLSDADESLMACLAPLDPRALDLLATTGPNAPNDRVDILSNLANAGQGRLRPQGQ